MARSWQLQTAKARLSALIDTSAAEGPQVVTRHGRPAAIVLSPTDYDRLRRRAPNFKRFLRKARLHELDLERNPDRGRKIRL
jgi:prevent-host-death family protein